jgi:hypothetical protein
VLVTSTVILNPDYTTVLREYAKYSAIRWNIANFERRKAK